MKSRKDEETMQSQLTTPDSPSAQMPGSGSATPSQKKKRASQRQGKHNFVHWDPEVQRAAFLNWLPKELHDAPGINWTQLSPNIMRYCIMTIKDSPDAAVLAVAAAAMRSIDQVSPQTALSQANQLLRDRGSVMGAALTTIALSNGSRVNELLQISFNKERRIVRTEEVPVLGNDGRPPFAEDGRPVLRQVKLHFQLLLPKGAKSDEERQLFPLSKEAIRLLGGV